MSEIQKSYREGENLEMPKFSLFKKSIKIQSLLAHSKITDVRTSLRYQGSDLFNKTRALRDFPQKSSFFFTEFDNLETSKKAIFNFNGIWFYSFYEIGLQKYSLGLKKWDISVFFFNMREFKKNSGYVNVSLPLEKLIEKPKVSRRWKPQLHEVVWIMNRLYRNETWHLGDNLTWRALGSLDIITGDYDPSFEDSKELADAYRNIELVFKDTFYKGVSLRIPEILQFSSKRSIFYRRMCMLYDIITEGFDRDFVNLKAIRSLYKLPHSIQILISYFFFKTYHVTGLTKGKYKYRAFLRRTEKNKGILFKNRGAEFDLYLKFGALRGKEHVAAVPELYRKPKDFNKLTGFSKSFRKRFLIFSVKPNYKLIREKLKDPYFKRSYVIRMDCSQFFFQNLRFVGVQARFIKSYSDFFVLTKFESFFLKIQNKFVKKKVAEERVILLSSKKSVAAVLEASELEIVLLSANKLKFIKKLRAACRRESPMMLKNRNWLSLKNGYSFKKQFHKQTRPLHMINLEKEDWQEVYWKQTEVMRTYQQVFGLNSKPFKASSKYSWTQKGLFAKLFWYPKLSFSARLNYMGSEFWEARSRKHKEKDELNIFKHLVESEDSFSLGTFFSKTSLKTPKALLGSRFIGVFSHFQQHFVLRSIPLGNKRTRKMNLSMAGLSENLAQSMYGSIFLNLLENSSQIEYLLKIKHSSVLNDFEACIWPRMSRPLSKIASKYFYFQKIKPFSAISIPHCTHTGFFVQQFTESCVSYKPLERKNILRMELFSVLSSKLFKKMKNLDKEQKKFQDLENFLVSFERAKKILSFKEFDLKGTFTPLGEMSSDYLTLINLARRKVLRESPLRAQGVLFTIKENKIETELEKIHKLFTALKSIKRQLANEKYKNIQRFKRKHIF